MSKEQDAREVLGQILTHMGIQATVEVREEADRQVLDIQGDESGLVIGKKGQTLEALQYLVSKILYRGAEGTPAGKPVIIDAEGYRARREEALHRQADQAADDAIRYKRPVALDAMTASERKLVHEYLRDRGDVETYSEGEEPDRHLMVAPLH